MKERLKRNLKDIVLVIVEILLSLWTSTVLALDITGVLSVELKWIPLVSFLGFALIIGVHMYHLYQRLSARMELVFGEEYPSCHYQKDGLTLYRVGVINRGGSTIEGFCPLLESIEPPIIRFTPVSLTIMNHPTEERVPLDPVGKDPSLFADMIAHEHTIKNDGSVTHTFRISYFPKYIPREIEPGDYTMQILATGKNVQPVRKRFKITWKDNHIRVENIKD